MGKIKDLLVEAMAKHPKGKPLTKDGMEVNDPVPVDPPVGYKAQPSMFEIVRKMIREEKLKAALEAEGFESPEEADDFEVGDDYEPSSPYEHNFDHVADAGELKRLRDAIDLRELELRGERRSPSPPSSDHISGGAGGAEGGGSQKNAPPDAPSPSKVTS